MSEPTFTGVRRDRRTRTSVRVADAIARSLITVGGVGTILAVCLICVFLVWVVLPLFSGGSVESPTAWERGEGGAAPAVLRIGVDEYRTMLWEVREDGVLTVRRLDDGRILESRPLFDDDAPTAYAFADGSSDVLFGFPNGTVVLGKLGFRTKFFDTDKVPEELRDLGEGELAVHEGGMATRTPEGQVRLQSIELETEEPLTLPSGEPIARLDYSIRPAGPAFAALTTDGEVYVEEIRSRTNLMTGKETKTLTGGSFRIETPEGEGLPDHLLLSGLGTNLYLVWNDGHLVRMNVSDPENPVRAEAIPNVLDSEGAHVTSVRFLIGKTTLLLGDSAGRTEAWFPGKPENADTVDGQVLYEAHVLPGPKAAVTALAPSSRSRVVAVGYADGRIRLYNVTNEGLVAEVETSRGEPVLALDVSPKENGIAAVTEKSVWRAALDIGHPDVTLSALFAPVWYEGYAEPEYRWQSTGATDDAEPKFGLVPLVFGTVKATVYSMLFGLPIALMAAVFASEFLDPKARAKIKPTIEIMASLPSVVLGFLAALVIAPFVGDRLDVVLTSFVAIPYTLLLGAHLWQLLPNETAIRLRRLRFPLIFACLPLAVLFAMILGPLVQDVVFGGSVKQWLGGERGTAAGGWFFLLLPFSALAVAAVVANSVSPRLRAISATWDRTRCGVLDLVKFLGASLAAVLLATLLGVALDSVGLDPRGPLLGTYVQRNAIIVGFVMGFAIIPIIFTIAEDALSAVPEHLRSASLGAGATPWQTAVRIIIPTAMSGLFSAVMIGLGRAVGETMIVLMAAGNTPIMEFNPFNGFETLSAALATELPEAVKDSSHFRVLFLAALVLFVLTFILNTVAEAVRIRFRKRAFEL